MTLLVSDHHGLTAETYLDRAAVHLAIGAVWVAVILVLSAVTDCVGLPHDAVKVVVSVRARQNDARRASLMDALAMCVGGISAGCERSDHG